jgi:hypothetical protein
LSDLAAFETDDVVASREEVKSVGDEESSLAGESSTDRFVEKVFSDVGIDLATRSLSVSVAATSSIEKAGVVQH